MSENTNSILTLFLHDGKTFHFEQVREFEVVFEDGEEKLLLFKYFGLTDKQVKRASFNARRLIGYSLTEV